MIHQTISISNFRASLNQVLRPVKLGRKELIVTYHGKPLFRVTKLCILDVRDLPESTLTHTRDRMSEFVDLLEEHGGVIIKSHSKRLVRCDLIK